jgi:hypothetical protein
VAGNFWLRTKPAGMFEIFEFCFSFPDKLLAAAQTVARAGASMAFPSKTLEYGVTPTPHS